MSTIVLNSMTGYASRSGVSDTGSWDWELRSVNGKGLDLRLRLPDGFEALEPVLRAEAKAQLARGNVTLTLKYADAQTDGAMSVDPDGLAAALEALSSIDAASQARGIDLAPTTAAMVATLPGVMSVQSDAGTIIPDAVKSDIPSVFADLVSMRATEGDAIGNILRDQLEAVAKIVSDAAQTAEARASRQGDVLRERVAALVDATASSDPTRLQQELAILAVKADVTEEIDRLRAHVTAAGDLLSEGGAVGRKLDFLMQEFNREANTLCSKSGSTELTTLGLELKVIVDQMREQVQNLE